MLVTKNNHQLGKQAEAIAMSYLNNSGFTKQVQNYRFQRSEIDLIVQKGNLLIFIEVKVRSHINFGYPESFVNIKQQQLYQLAANEYIHSTGWQGHVRFDIIAFVKMSKSLQLTHIKDAFY